MWDDRKLLSLLRPFGRLLATGLYTVHIPIGTGPHRFIRFTDIGAQGGIYGQEGMIPDIMEEAAIAAGGWLTGAVTAKSLQTIPTHDRVMPSLAVIRETAEEYLTAAQAPLLHPRPQRAADPGLPIAPPEAPAAVLQAHLRARRQAPPQAATMAAAIAAKLNHASEWDWNLVALQGIEPWFDG